MNTLIKSLETKLPWQRESLSKTSSDQLFYEVEYQSFLNWWQRNQERFDNLSFRIENQINLFFDQLPRIGFEDAFSQLRTDLYGYYLEYIKQQGVIPFTLKIRDDNRIVGEFYGDRDIEEIIDEREREGVVKKAIIDLKKRLMNLEPGRIIFRISPSGWTGFDYQYTETQAQIFWRDDFDSSKIRGLTIRTQMSLEEILSFLNYLGVEISQELTEEKEVIKRIVSLNISLPCSFNQFLPQIIDGFKNQDHQGRDLERQIDIWRIQDSNFFYFDQIAGVLGFVEGRIKELINLGLSEEEIRLSLRSLIGFVLMLMTGQSLRERLSKNFSLPEQVVINSDIRYLPLPFYDQIFDHLQSLPGCAGGGNSLVSNFVMGVFGSISITNEKTIDEIKCVVCPFCGQVVDAQIVNNGNKTYICCPKCKSRVEKN